MSLRLALVVYFVTLVTGCTGNVAPVRGDYRPLDEAPDLPITVAGQQVVDAWLAKAAPWQARLAAIPADASVAQNLSERTAVDSGMRRLLAETGTAALAPADRKAAELRIFQALGAIDKANIAWLKTALPRDGWFRISRDGSEVAHNAWLLVQHSPDADFMARIAARMAPLARMGEVAGADFALLYDRTEVFAGRPQYYGSQVRCENNRWVPQAIRDPGGVDARRQVLGLRSLADNIVRLNAAGGC